MLPFFETRRGGPVRAELIATLALLIALLVPVAAQAEGPTFALKPKPETESGYFEFTAGAGQSVSGQVEVTNVGSQPGSTRLYAVDATTGATSGAVYRSRTERKRKVGRWTQISSKSVTLEPGQSTVVPFTVQLPDELSPGQYLGGVVAQRSTQTVGDEGEEGEGKTGFQVKVQALSVLAIEVDVPGPEHPAMTVSGITPGDQPGHQSLVLGIGNSGNVLLKGKGTLKVVNQAGRKVQDQEFALDTFVPKTRIEYPVYVKGKTLPAGRYQGKVSLTYQGHHLTRRFGFKITTDDTEQVFGETAASEGGVSGTSASSSSNETIVYVLIAVCALSLATAFYFWRQRRPA